MKILLINKFHYKRGGSETYYFAQAEALRAKGHEVIFFAMQDEKNIECEQSEFFVSNKDYNNNGGIGAKVEAVKSFFYSKEAADQMEKLIQKEKPDIAHIGLLHRQITFSVVEVLKKHNIPVVMTMHDLIFACPNYTMLTHGKVCEACVNGSVVNCIKEKCVKDSIAKSTLAALEKVYLKRKKYYDLIDLYITECNQYKGLMEKSKITRSPIRKMSNFLPIDQKYEFNSNYEDYVLYFGRFSREKGILTLLKAHKESGCKRKLILVGAGPQLPEIEKYIADNKLINIELPGAIYGEQMEDIIEKSRVIVVPSEWYENCPYALLQSLAKGKIVIASRIGGLPELIKEEKTGFLFEAGNSTDLMHNIEKVFAMSKDKYESMSRLIVEEAKKDHYWENYIDKLLGYYEKLIKKYKPNGVNKKMAKKRAKKNESEKKLNGTVIVTYRCNARCSMCNRYKAPSKPEEEISIETIKKLPKMYFTNITGGEPFIRTDLKDIVRELYKKSDRIVISTNGFFTERIIDLAKEYPNIGIRISIEGLEQTNNDIRGLQDGYNRGYTTLKKLREMGMKDVGFGMTVQDKNAPDLVPLYKISDEMGMEFATASLHNSFYFVEAKNIIHDRPMVAKNFESLVNELLKSNSPKKWFRAYFNHGLINYIYGQKRLLPCDMSFDTFFIDPYGDVMPCNGTKDKEVMGNLNNQSWDELWNSKEAEAVRKKVRHCDRDCWMIGSVSPAMHKYIWKPATWVVIHKVKSLLGMEYSMYENKIVRDLRDGKVTKEELDKCSTCDMCAVVNNGLSEASKAQLVGKTGEEIVDADIAAQMKK